ncbi:MAG: pyruvate kinase [Lachnospiraceae bacterium]|nr:pyruvate kinase [Lachnospiraceae bacterium]
MRKTKIICTIGPASESEEVLKKMCLAGMNVARLNFSHGTHPEHEKKIAAIKKVREELHLPIAIMLDTKGPEYRIGTFEEGKIYLNEGDTFTFTSDEIVGNQERVSVSYKTFAQEMNPGDKVLVNNGLVVLEVVETSGNDVVCKVLSGGKLSDRKSMNFPGKRLRGAYMSEQDQADVLFGIEHGVDFVAASFVSDGADAKEMRDFLDAHGGEDIDIVAKIENQSGIDHVDEICKYADGIMVARGDLGVEIPFTQVPSVQKNLVEKCRMLGKRVVVATEMLESMIENIRPTRAEVSDIANAIYEGTSAIMLSGESAAGKHPVEAVQAMANIAEETEQHIDYAEWFENVRFTTTSNLDAVSHAACRMAIDVGAKCIAVSSVSGITARMISRFRCPVPIMGITTSEKAYRKLALSWGVLPRLCERFDSLDVIFYHAMREAQRMFDLEEGDNIVMTGGRIGEGKGKSNTIRLETIRKR